MTTKLELPERTPAGRDEAFTSLRGTRRWLEELEGGSDRETVARFIEGLKHVNRLELRPDHRLKVAELLRPTARRLIGRFDQRISTQRLPLDDASRRNFQALLTLLREQALAYDIAVDALAAARRPARSKLALVIERALGCRGETMLRCAQVHAPLPQVFWHDSHSLYRLAESCDCAERRVRDDELVVAPRHRQSPLDMYRRLLLFGIAPTDGLRRSQAERLYRRLETWCRLADMKTVTAVSADEAQWFHVDLAAPDPPQPGVPAGGNTADTRMLDITSVLTEVQRLLPDAPSENDVPGAAEVDAAALSRLIDGWSGRVQRRGERAVRSEPADIETSLKRIRERLLADAAPPEIGTTYDRSRPLGTVSSLALQTIERPDHEWQGERKQAAADRARDLPGTWGAREEKQAVAAAPSKATPENQRNWALVDTSDGGFRLRWEGGTSSPATVGELVALHQELPATGNVPEGEEAPLRERWSLGVIRRIRMIDDSRFDAGVETLGRHPAPAVVRREPANPHRKRDRKSEPVEPALVLPAVRSREIPATVLVPAHLFREGEILELDVQDRVLRVRLGTARESSSAFTRFELTTAPTRGRSAASRRGKRPG